jgi:hypothetical protein
VSITQKCGFKEQNFIEPECMSRLKSACPGIAIILRQYGMNGIRPNYSALVKECSNLKGIMNEQELNSCYDNFTDAIANASETDDEACQSYFIDQEKCDGSAVGANAWTGEEQSLGVRVR